jgi:hypothetical protein
MTIYVELTRELNRGRLRAVICSGQAVVLHRLAIMSKRSARPPSATRTLTAATTEGLQDM